MNFNHPFLLNSVLLELFIYVLLLKLRLFDIKGMIKVKIINNIQNKKFFTNEIIQLQRR